MEVVLLQVLTRKIQQQEFGLYQIEMVLSKS